MSEKWLAYDEKIKPIVSKFGKKLSFLGSGAEGGVWSIDDNFTIKLYKNHRDYSTQPIPELETKIYASGNLDGMFWVIKELFDVPRKEHHEFFAELIIDISGVVEREIESSKYKEPGESFWIAEKSIKKIMNCPDIDFLEAERMRDLYALNKNWLSQLTIEIAYKSLTDRGLDFHVENLGIRRADRKLIFFDW